MKTLIIILALTAPALAQEGSYPSWSQEHPSQPDTHCTTTCDYWGQNCQTDCTSSDGSRA